MAWFDVFVLLNLDRSVPAEQIELSAMDLLEPFRFDTEYQAGKYDGCLPDPCHDDLLVFPPEVSNWEVCPFCWGTGEASSEEAGICGACHGEGTRSRVWQLTSAVVAASALRPQCLPYAVVTPEGNWQENREQIDTLIKQHGNGTMVMFHCHG